MYTLEAVDMSYGNVPVIRGISCKIPTKEFVFIMGPSGSGKSTLLRLLSFVEKPDAGRISLKLDGRSYESDEPLRPWPQLTCVFQRQFLWPHLTLRENISLPLKAYDLDFIGDKLEAVIQLFDMSAFVDRYPNEVSGGQAQRAALARALVLEPKLILIDEAHGGLDPEQQVILNEYLLKLQRSGLGLIVVSHSLQFARRYADQIYVIENGLITDSGPRSILEHPSSPFLRRVT